MYASCQKLTFHPQNEDSMFYMLGFDPARHCEKNGRTLHALQVGKARGN